MRPVRRTVFGGTRRMPSFPVLRSLEAFLLSGFALVSQPKPVPRNFIRGTKLNFASGPMEMALASGNRVESITGNTASGNYFSALGLRPALGRLFTSADEEGHAPVAVLSYGFWKRAFARPENATG